MAFPGIFPLIGQMIQQSIERSSRTTGNFDEAAAIDPATGGRAFESDPRLLPRAQIEQRGSLLVDAWRAAQGRITSLDAHEVGIPEAAGLSRQSLEDLLNQRGLPLKEAKQRQDIESGEALEEQRRSKAINDREYREQAKDPVFGLAVQSVEKELASSPIAAARYASDPEARHKLYSDRFVAFKAIKSGKQPKPVGKPATGAAAAKGGGRIRVKIGNQTGTIDEKDFDPKSMTRLGG